MSMFECMDCGHVQELGHDCEVCLCHDLVPVNYTKSQAPVQDWLDDMEEEEEEYSYLVDQFGEDFLHYAGEST